MSFRLGATDRRKRPRGVPPAEPHRQDLVSRILGSYREMPGLSLQPAQAGRLFGISLDTCLVVFDELVRGGQLGRAADGRYVRAVASR